MSLEMFSLKGRNALVTGSSQGIGWSIAKAYALAGAHVILNGRNEDKLKKAAERLKKEHGVTVSLKAFDVTDAEAVKKGVEEIEREVGAIHILVNNAGMQSRKPLEEFDSKIWQQILDLNLTSIFTVSQAVVQGMIKRGEGKIINICSLMSEVGRFSIAPYTASKGGLKMLTKGMCVDWARHNIQVNGIGPGYFATEMNTALVEDPKFTSWLEQRTPAQRWGNVEELEGAAIFLASPAANFVNGHILYVDGGVLASL